MSKNIFTRMLNFKYAKEIWDFLKKEYSDYERTRDMQLFNLAREFEMQSMEDK